MARTTLPLSAVVGAAGTATLTIKPNNRRRWEIQQINCEGTGVGSTAQGVIRVNNGAGIPFVARLDAPAGDPPVPLSPGDKMTIEWSQCTVGATVKAFVIYDDGT